MRKELRRKKKARREKERRYGKMEGEKGIGGKRRVA